MLIFDAEPNGESHSSHLHSIPGGATGQQEPHDVQVPAPGRIVERRVVLVASGVHQGLVPQQQLHHLEVPVIAGFVLITRRESKGSCNIHHMAERETRTTVSTLFYVVDRAEVTNNNLCAIHRKRKVLGQMLFL